MGWGEVGWEGKGRVGMGWVVGQSIQLARACLDTCLRAHAGVRECSRFYGLGCGCRCVRVRVRVKLGKQAGTHALPHKHKNGGQHQKEASGQRIDAKEWRRGGLGHSAAPHPTRCPWARMLRLGVASLDLLKLPVQSSHAN